MLPNAQELGNESTPSQQTRAAAFRDSRKRSKGQRASIIEAFEAAGARGLTREEVAAKAAIPLQSACRPVRDLEREGLLIETTKKRPTRYGKTAVVLVHRDAIGGA
jgi:hypothetical protein